MNFSNSNQLIIHCSYHKVATTFFGAILRKIANEEQIIRALSIVNKLSFEKRKGSSRGKENRKSHFRKGVAGD